jgi:type III pantothenate kinase
MKPDVVVDVGNTRIKWGKCAPEGVVEIASLPPDDACSWTAQIAEWGIAASACWAVSGVHPARRDQLADWLQHRGATVMILENYRRLPLRVAVPNPKGVGIDRLLNAVAAANGRGRVDTAIIVDAGTAVTVDWVDGNGAFRGGAILPGFRLMAQALHEHTALLPVVDTREPNPSLPGTDTESAIRAGVYWAVAGGVKALIRQLSAQSSIPRRSEVFITGGNAGLLLPVMDADVRYWPEMTLEGIRLAAEAQP